MSSRCHCLYSLGPSLNSSDLNCEKRCNDLEGEASPPSLSSPIYVKNILSLLYHRQNMMLHHQNIFTIRCMLYSLRFIYDNRISCKIRNIISHGIPSKYTWKKEWHYFFNQFLVGHCTWPFIFHRKFPTVSGCFFTHSFNVFWGKKPKIKPKSICLPCTCYFHAYSFCIFALCVQVRAKRRISFKSRSESYCRISLRM